MKPTTFISKQYLWESFKTRVLPHLTEKEDTRDLVLYTLPKPMNDYEIKSATSSVPMPAETFASVAQRFLKTASKENWYIFHVQTSKEVVAVDVFWHGGEWDFNTYDLDDDAWYGGGVFVSFATGTSETSNETLGNSVPLSLESALQTVKEAGYKIYKEI